VDELVDYEVDCSSETFDLEVAIPLGLILNEAITNAVKYAFKEGEKGLMQIQLTTLEDGFHKLTIKDDGVGISDDYIHDLEESLGIELINILSEQLEGSVEISNDNGTKMEIHFKA
jgi:two-component sensor histidine kinase